MNNVLDDLVKVLQDRKAGNPEKSYVASLYSKGLDEILKKIGEEASETIIAAKNGHKKEIIHETADLWFHTLVLLTHVGFDVNDVLNELQRRFGRSGIDEKEGRQ